jgi:hypothetical protein
MFDLMILLNQNLSLDDIEMMDLSKRIIVHMGDPKRNF